MRVRLLLIASLSAALAACVFSQSSAEDPQTETAAATASSCVAGARPSSGYGTAPALGGQVFSQPVAMIPVPNDSTVFYVVEQKGTIRRASTSGPATLFADLHTSVRAGGEAGLLGLALHPKFAENGVVFLSYTKPSTSAASGLASVIARAKSSDGGLTLSAGSVTELLSFDQPFSNHNGGNVVFGPDGYLYISFGDGGSGGDPNGNGQNKNVWFGKIHRIDVDHGSPYTIPADNPFKNGGGKAEIFAYGLRNTWRFSFDRVTGDLWAGDVGQNKYEEIDKIVLGGNYGWNTREGLHCYTSASCPSPPGAIDPIVEYDHSQGSSVTGGFVYRGSAIPDLYGQYLYGDYGSGRVWAIPSNVATPTPRVLLNANAISSFAQDNAGELYILNYSAGTVGKIVPTLASDGIPQKLSETGCFLASNPQVATDKLIPYDVNSPLWSDGAEKNRWMAIPPNGKIRVAADGDWDLPVGSILVKEFRLGGKRIETRLFMRHTDGSWAGYTYEWNDAQTDATLLPDGKTKTVGGQTWTYPSRAQCMGCHNGAAGFSLGLETAQLNRAFDYADGAVNQLTKLEAMGLFEAPLPVERPALPSPSSVAASAEEKARSYLHSNCGFCHRPQGPGRGVADFRFSRTFKGTHVCNAEPEAGDLDIDGAKLVVPGDTEHSLVSARMHRTDFARMPPLGTALVDTKGTALIDSWIKSITACP